MDRLSKFYNSIKDDLKKPKSKDDSVLIVDGTNTFKRVFSAVPSINDDGIHVGGVVGFLKSIGSNIRQFNATRCIVVFDGRGGSLKRKKIFPDYKSGRKNKVSLNRFKEFDSYEDEYQSMKSQFLRIIDYLDVLPVEVIAIDNIEADDTIAYIAKQYYKDKNNNIVIVSSDKDFLQLVSDNISVYRPTVKKLYNKENFKDEFGVIPENYLLCRMVSGDTSDNIPGVNGVGVKTLLKHFDLSNPKVTHNDIINECKNRIEFGVKYKAIKAISQSFDVLDRNYKLMQLHEVDIPTRDKLIITDRLNSPINKLNVLEFRKLYVRDKLYSNITYVDDWINKTFKRLEVYART